MKQRMVLAAVLAAIATAVVSSRQERPASALIIGRVVDAATNQPVAGAVVSIGGSTGRGQSAPTTVLATESGYFVFRDLPAASLTISASASGYLPGGLGQRRIGGPLQPLAVAAGSRQNITVRLWREATLAGTITDETGEPLAALTVSLLPAAPLGRASARADASVSAVPVAQTDSTGAYRFSSLVPGDYIVSVPSRLTQVPATLANADARMFEGLRASGLAAAPSGFGSLGRVVRLGDTLVQTSEGGGSNAFAGRLPMSTTPDGAVRAYAATFFPGTSSFAAAERIRLGSGDDRYGVNFRITPSVLRRIRGRLTGPGGPVSGMAVHLIPAFASETQLERTHEAAITVSRADGTFSFDAVSQGDYVIKAWHLPQSAVIGADSLPAESTLWARVPVTVSARESDDVAVVLKPGSSIRGRIVHDGVAAVNPPARLQTVVSVAFEPPWTRAFLSRLATRVTPSYEFMTMGVPPGSYPPALPNQFLAAPTGWFFESIQQNGRDLMVAPLNVEPATDSSDVVITLADRRTTLSGRITDAGGKPHPAAAVVVFPADTRTWIENGLPLLASFSGTASQAGAFVLDVRPGDYFVAGIEEARLSDWRREVNIPALAAQAVRVRVARGENPAQELRVVPLRAQVP